MILEGDALYVAAATNAGTTFKLHLISSFIFNTFIQL